MSYPRDLDEIPEDELRAELRRRENARVQGVCDYCGRKHGADPDCKFPRRHRLGQTFPCEPKDDDPVSKLAQWLSRQPQVVEDLAERLHLALPKCEGHRYPCDGIVLRDTAAMTSYEWDGQGEDPNRPQRLCFRCSAEYVEDWQERWDEYYAGVLP